MQPEEYIAIDLGTKLTGVARGSSLAKIAQPLVTIKTDELITKLHKIITDNNVQAVVVGLPRNLSGDDTNQTKWVRKWVEKSKNQLRLPLYWQDEALTSVHSSGDKSENKADEHSSAAAMILQDFLDGRVEERLLA